MRESVEELAALPLPTTAVTRSLDDLHLPTWFALQGATTAIRTAVLHPLSLAASRRRVSDNASPSSIRGIVAAAFQRSPVVARSAGDVHPIHRLNSIRNIYRGFGVAVVGNVIGEISCLWTVEAVKQSLLHAEGDDPHSGKHTPLHAAAIAGALGDFVAILLTTPLSIVCDRQLTSSFGMARANPYQSATRTFWTVWGTTGTGERNPWRRGVSNLYAGAPASFAMMPAAAVWWSAYVEIRFRLYQSLGGLFDQVRERRTACTSALEYCAGPPASGHDELNNAAPCRPNRLHHRGPMALADENWLLSSKDNPVINGFAGLCASVVTSLLFTPLTVIRTRLQTLPHDDANGRRRGARFRFAHVTTTLYRADGIAGFYRGAVANVSIALLDGLAFSTLYEFNKLGSDKALLGSG